jgi:hypothetical protein
MLQQLITQVELLDLIMYVDEQNLVDKIICCLQCIPMIFTQCKMPIKIDALDFSLI